MESNPFDISIECDANGLLRRSEEEDDVRSSIDCLIICTKCSKGVTPLYGPPEVQNVIVENIFPLNEDKKDNIRMLYCNPCHLCVAIWIRLRWWNVDGLLFCASKSTSIDPILKEVRTYGERLLLWLLNRIVFNEYENEVEGLVFLPVPEQDIAKILWHRGKAIGFYSVKPKFSDFGTYESTNIPIVDLVFVRKEHRGKDFGSVIVGDVVDAFDSDVGFSQPITPPMYNVLKRFLVTHPLHRQRLWECGDSTRCNIWLRLCSDAAREAKKVQH